MWHRFWKEDSIENAPRSKHEQRRMLTANLPGSARLWHRQSSKSFAGGPAAASHGMRGPFPSARDLRKANQEAQAAGRAALDASSDDALRQLVRLVTPDRLGYVFKLLGVVAKLASGEGPESVQKLRAVFQLQDLL